MTIFRRVGDFPADDLKQRQWASRLQDELTLSFRRSNIVYNVRDFGALGNGVTDDRLAFNRAIAQANSAGGGIVFVPPGTYSKGSSSILMLSNVELVGCGRSTVIKNANSSNATHILNFEANSPTDAGVYNLVLDGNRANQVSGTSLAVVGLNAARVTFEKCWLKDPYAFGIFGNFTVNTGEVYIRHCRGIGTFGATAGADHGIKLAYPSLVECRHEIIDNYLPKTAGFGYSLLFVEGATVALNHAIGDTTGTLNEGFNFDRCRALSVVGNHSKYRGDFGFTFHSSNSTSLNDGHTFVGNVAEWNKEAGLAITGKTRYSTFIGNTLRNNAQNPTAYACEILVDTGSATAKPSFNLIQGNALIDDQGAPTASAAIIVNGANCEDTQIGKNVISGIGIALTDSGTRTRIWGDGIGGNYQVGNGRTFFQETDDVNASGVSGSVIVGSADGSGAHIALDGNEIMAKASASSAATLGLNNEGGQVNIGGSSLTTQNTDQIAQINSGDHGGANDKSAAIDFARGGTALWREGIQGSILTDGGWRLTDRVNNTTPFVAKPGTIPTVALGHGGSDLVKVVVYSPTLTPVTVSAASIVEQTFTVTGLSTADKIFVNAQAVSNNVAAINWHVTATDTLVGAFCNVAGILDIPASAIYRIVAIRS